MTLPSEISKRLTLPAICAPMFLVSGPELVSAACRAGLIGALPRQNARSLEDFAEWLRTIRSSLDAYQSEHPDAVVGPLAANITGRVPADEIPAHLEVCARYGVDIIISAAHDPTELTKRVHDRGGWIYHDVTTWRHAEKAIAAGVDGLICIGVGGGGHSGVLSPLVMIPRLRAMFDGVIVMAGAVAHGAAIRAAEVLGADLAYVGTRFIATEESLAPAAYKQMLVECSSDDLMFTGAPSTVMANWLLPSAAEKGIDTTEWQPHSSRRVPLPENTRVWRDIWSAGQGVDLITDVPSAAEVVRRLRDEYAAACDRPALGAGPPPPR